MALATVVKLDVEKELDVALEKFVALTFETAPVEDKVLKFYLVLVT